jgi:hypothetical protein
VRQNGEIGWKLLQALAARFRDGAETPQASPAPRVGS